MKCSLEQITAAAQGAVRIEGQEDGIHFFRFTQEQQNVYAGSAMYRKCLATAGVVLAFRTDSRRLTLSVSAAVATNRHAFAHDILKDGRLIGQLGNQDQVEMKKGSVEGEPVDRPGSSLGEFTGTFDLGDGEKEIRIVFPWSVVSVLEDLELEDGASMVPAVRSGKKILFYGDSITQGYDAKYPSMHHTMRLAALLGAEGLSRAIGADRFCPKLAACRDAFEPEYILVAYGTNDWTHLGWEEFQRNCSEFYRLLAEGYPKARILALTPIWRKDHEAEKEMGEFSRVGEWIEETTAQYSNITVIRGFDLVPHDSRYYSDGRLHPNDDGFREYYEGLEREFKKLGLAV